MLLNLGRGMSPLVGIVSESGSSTLLDIRPDALMHLCASDADSYDGVDGLVKNLLDDSGYNFNDGGMPLVGSVGGTGAYLTLDNKYMSIATPNPNFIKTIGRSNVPWWLGIGLHTNDTSGGCSLFTNQDAGVGGVYIKKQGNESSVVSFKTASGNKSAVPAYPYMPLGVNNFILHSFDGVDKVHTWHGRDGAKITKTIGAFTDTAINKTSKCNLFATYSGGTKFSSGTDSRMYSVMMGSGVVSTDEQYAEIVAFAEAKDGVPYLPV